MGEPKTIIVGLGNPLVTDDGVGIVVARRLRQTLTDSQVEIEEAYAGGLRLMDVLVGYDRAILVDAMVTQGGEAGTVRTLSLRDMVATRNTVSSHDTNLALALELGRLAGLRLPAEIALVGIEAADVSTFGETLTHAVAEAVPQAADLVMALLQGGEG